MAEFVIRGAGSVLRQHRLAQHLTLAELAEKAGSDKSQLAKYEANKVGVSDVKLMMLAKALRIPAAQLAHECLVAIKPQIRSKPIGKLLAQISIPKSSVATRARTAQRGGKV